jgi:anaerobic magnesium-protoporphyrin IX monomethyl ester cyclase
MSEFVRGYMSISSVDLLIVNPGNAEGVYQSLSQKYSGIEPPTWALLLAESVRSQGHKVAILDINAERLSVPQALERIRQFDSKLICFVVYGQNVNAGTVSMSGAIPVSKALKDSGLKTPIAYLGSYIQALPIKALKDESSIDFGFTNEGVYALRNVLKLSEINSSTLKDIKGIVRRDEKGLVVMNPAEAVVPTSKMDKDLPGYAWDLLPYKNRPLDLYRSPLWHANYNEEDRSPYAAIQTSLGCNFGCSFCMINIVNRSDNDEIGVSSNYKGMRFWSTEFNLKQFDILAEMGIKTIRIVDEMFLLYKKHYDPLCTELAKRPYAKDLKMWSYSRIDTVTDPDLLKTVRAAGIQWLALGIESGDKRVRLEVSKGKFEDVDIKRVIKQVHEADIEVMGNYIVGLPGDNHESMELTYQLSEELNTSGWNMYAAMALPGSQLYKTATENGYNLPDSYTGFSFHSVDSLPIPTESLSPAEILKFRDEAFLRYHTNSNFLKRIKNKYGSQAVDSIKEMTKIKLTRNILQ